jgi:spermidine synthase
MSRADRWLVVAFGLSGAAALGYELLWTQLLSLALGHETLGVLGVLAGFFGGMAAGAAALHPRAKAAANPARMFVRLELIAAGYAVLSPWLLHGLATTIPAMLGPVAGDNDSPLALGLAIGISAVTLLPATFCMGATLPALVEARRRALRDEPDGRGVGRLYAANALGGTAGVLATTYVLLPQLGAGIGAAVLAGLGLGSAALASRWAKDQDLRPLEEADAPTLDTSGDPDPDVAREPWLLLVVLTGTGLLGVGLEVVGVQVLSQTLENTIYTFAHTLAVYLLGTSVGAFAYARWVKPALAGRPATVLAGLLIAQALTVLLASFALSAAPGVMDSLAPADASWTAHLWAELVVAAMVFALPTVVMGATFSHAVGLLAPSGIGRAYALNTLGGAVAPLLFALWVVPAQGYRDGLFVVLYGYVAVFGVFTWYRRFTAKQQLAAIVGVVALTFTAPASLVLAEPDDGWTVLTQEETMMGLVIVSEQTEGDPPMRRLQVGQEFRMGGARAFGERRMGHIPLLLHPSPTRALFLGVGTGATLGAATAHDSLMHVDAVELVPAVLDQLHHFTAINGNVAEADNVHLHAADGRRFVAASEQRYDVVVADLFHPGRNGAGGLYAAEHFEAVREQLAEGGLFAQWLPLYQMDAPTLKMVTRTFTDVFPHTQAWLGLYNVDTPAVALVGSNAPLLLSPPRIAEAVAAPIYTEVLMQEPRDLLGAFLMDRDGLVAFAGEGPRNTDLHPRVMLRAPQVAYEGNRGRGWTNLAAMLEHRTPLPLAADTDPIWADDAARFARAVDAHLHAEAARAQMENPGDLAQLPEAAVEHYLTAYEAAPEFAASRGMLYLTGARAPQHAATIFERMLARTPDEQRVYQAYLQALAGARNKPEFDRVRALATARFGPGNGGAQPPKSD